MYKLLLCIRYLRTRYIALASITSVMLGVATMIVVNSVLAGFTNEMRDRIHGFLADVLIESRHTEGIKRGSKEMLRQVDAAIGEHVAAMTPTVEIPGMAQIRYGTETYPMPISLVGIRPMSKAEVGPLRNYLGNHQPREIDGQVLPPLKSPDDPVDWELTDGALERRRVRKQLQREWLQRQQMIQATTEPAAKTDDSTVSAISDVPQFDDEPPGPVADVSEEPGPESSIDDLLTQENPFGPDPFGPDNAYSEADMSAPLAARVYIGEGLVSYMATDPETGERHKVMMAEPGDDITITTVKIGMTGKPETVSFDATIVDIFRSGMSEYDGQLVLMNLEQLQRKRGMLYFDTEGNVISDSITSVQIRLNDYADAKEVVATLEASFPPSEVHVETWETKQNVLLSAVEMETAILNVLLFLIITVAGFGILAIFFMIVVEKTRDIGILKSLGASSRGVMSIFLSYGLALGLVGSMAGVVIGLVFVRYINEIEDGLSWLTGREVFDRDIYYFDTIPTHVSPLMVFWVAVGAMAIAVLASVLPARRASRLHPVRALRFD
jgi:lipoprotein-releasing system permease protein